MVMMLSSYQSGHVICHLTGANAEISMRLRVQRGRGYVPCISVYIRS